MTTYSGHMTTAQNPERVLADLIREASDNYKIAGRELLATAAGVSPKTFDRYMAGVPGGATFTLPQLIRIAAEMNVPLSAILPSDDQIAQADAA